MSPLYKTSIMDGALADMRDTGVATVQEIKTLWTQLKAVICDFIPLRRDSAAAGVASPVTCPQDRLKIPAAAKVLQFGRSKSLPTMPHIRQLAAVLQLCQYSLLTVITATLK